MATTTYTTPKIETFEGSQIVESLGPVSAGSGRIGGLGGGGSEFRPNTNTCGTPLGYPCP